MLAMQIILVLMVVGLVVWFWLRGRTVSRIEKKTAEQRIDTVTGWPPQATRVLTNQERIVFGTLVRALPEYMILAQVPLARFVSVPKRNSYVDWLRRLGYQCADFVVCDMAAQVVAVVELQPLHPSDRARKRLTRMSRTLKAAEIPLHIWNEEAVPAIDAVREILLPRLSSIANSTTTQNQPAASSSTTKTQDNQDSIQDDAVELLEPPASTWFDELDTDVAPLGKH
jgi:hypothetical protein